MKTGETKAVELLARLIGDVSRDAGDAGVGADSITSVENGAQMTIVLPSSDRYSVSVTWLGDREGQA